jgi:hypothetical protein
LTIPFGPNLVGAVGSEPIAEVLNVADESGLFPTTIEKAYFLV